MDFIDKALELEVETIERYKTLASMCAAHEGIRHILNMLISDHKAHLASLRSLQDKEGFGLEDTDVFSEIGHLLEDMRSKKDTFSCDIDQLQLYRTARDLVLEKQELYQKTQSRLYDQASRDLIERLIREEKKQAVVLDNIIRMVERPEQWLEDAEFSHLDEY